MVLLGINDIVRMPPLVGFFEMVAISFYVCAFFNILNVKIPYKKFIVVNLIHLIVISLLWLLIDQVSLLRMITAVFTIYIILTSTFSFGLQERILNIKSYYNVSTNIVVFLAYKLVLSFYRVYSANYEVGINSITVSIVVFSFILLLLIIWINFTIMFINYDLLNSQYRHLSFNDYLTNIPNRRYAVLRLNEALTQSKNEDVTFGVLLLDINEFKFFNDTYGHDFGDLVLVEFVNKMKSLMRTDDLFSRYGGDEFLIMIKMKKKEELIHFIHRIQKYFNQNTITDKDITIKYSLGKSYIDSSTNLNIKQLIEVVDKGLYKSKKKVKEGVYNV